MIDYLTDQQRIDIRESVNNRRAVIARGIEATADIGGEVWECGTFEGDTALWAKSYLGDSPRVLRLFDTFAGLPLQGPNDTHQKGTMVADYDKVVARFEGLNNVVFHRGIMPTTFAGLEGQTISVVNIDVDQEESVRECLEWLYPRVHSGGWIVIDDYNDGSCHGAKLATNAFLEGKPEQLNTSGNPQNPQAHFVKV